MPLLFSTIQQQGRNAGAYPAQRGGSDLPSIVSAAGVQAVQGERDSVRAALQRHLAKIFEEMGDISARLDVKVLDFEKPLMVPSGNKTVYKPSTHIKDRYYVQALYPNQSMSPLNREVLNFQALGNGIMSHRTAMEQASNIPDADLEFERIWEEQGMTVLVARFLAQADEFGTIAYIDAKDEGKSAKEAIRALIQANQAPLPALGQQPGQAPEGAPATAEEQANAIDKGATAPQGPGGPPGFAPPPLKDILPPAALTQNLGRVNSAA